MRATLHTRALALALALLLLAVILWVRALDVL